MEIPAALAARYLLSHRAAGSLFYMGVAIPEQLKGRPMTNTRVLVVDDDRTVSGLVARILTDRGYTVDVANDGRSALKLVAKNSYALAVLDYQMPDMNGVEVFQQARETQPELLGIFLTAYANINTVFPAIDAGIERVLAKPPSQRELVPVVEELMRSTIE